MTRRSLRRAGFTLVELAIVIAIIMALAGLLLTWGLNARAGQKRQATYSTMASLLVAADVLKNNSAVLPDHRLANYVWVQPHASGGGVPPWSGTARQMSSAEFFLFLAAMNPDTKKMVQSIAADYVKPSAVPTAWGDVPSEGFCVDVFMQYPGAADVFDKAALGPPASTLPAPSYAVMSGLDGYPLRSAFDPWGNEMIYRFATDKNELNAADGTYPKLAPATGTYTVLEKIAQDEKVTADRYAVLGEPVVAATEYVRPAVAAYPYPFFVSPGKDGLWGAFAPVVDASGVSEVLRDARAPDKNTTRDDKAKDNIYSQEENS